MKTVIPANARWPSIWRPATPRFLRKPIKPIAVFFREFPYTTEEQVRSILAVADHPKAAGADPKEFFDNRFIKELEDRVVSRNFTAQH